MKGFRAKDADRDRFVELIEAAYVDGQIGDADRELRIGRALSAETLDELQTLTRDLQVPAGLTVPAPAPAPTPSSSPSPSRVAAPSRQRHAAGVVAGLGAFVVLLVVGVTAVVALFAVAGESERVTSQGVDPASPVRSAQATPVETDPRFSMTQAQVRRFLTAYEKQFGTAEAYEVAFFPDRVQAKVPVRGSRPRMERWTWNGAWRQDTEAAAVTGPEQRVDAGAIDVRRMFANIGVARRTLDVERGQFTHAVLHRWSDEPTSLNLYVGNDFNETGYLRTTPAGEVVRAYPYDA